MQNEGRNRNRNRESALAGLVLGLSAWILIAAANPSPTLRVGFVDTQRIAAESQSIRKMIGDAATKAEELRKELQKSRGELSARLEAYSAQKTVVTGEEERRRSAAIQQLKDETEVLEFRLDREVKRSQAGMVGPMGMKILDAIRAESKEQGLTAVFTTQDVVHYDSAYDVTAAVIRRLDR